MRYIICILLCFTVAAAHAQQISDKQIKENIQKLDSQTKEMNESIERNMRIMDSVNMARSNEQMARNMDSFMAERREQEHKKLVALYWRLGFVGLMLVLVVVRFVRRKKGKGRI